MFEKNSETIKKALSILERETNCNECACINCCRVGTSCVFTEALNLLNTYESRIKILEDIEKAYLRGETI